MAEVRTVRSMADVTADVMVVGFFPGRRPAPGTARVKTLLGGWVTNALAASGFDGASGQTVVLPSTGSVPAGRVVAVGLGGDLDLEGLRQAAGRGVAAVDGADRVATTLHRVGIDGAPGAVIEGIRLAGYRFDDYRSTTADRSGAEGLIELVGRTDAGEADVARALAVADSVVAARDMVNRPSADKAPLDLAEAARAMLEPLGVSVDVWTGDRLAEERLGGLLGVGGGSHRPPCLVRAEYRPRRPRGTVALVGKGIVFDSGGLSLKTTQFMETMKIDMSGAAAVFAAVAGIARIGARHRVVAYVPLAENMPGGGAQRPGDVLRIRNGKTIEVLNTDAEGRLVLADALSLAAEEEPDLIVDLATLTGACHVALGDKIAGLWSSEDAAGERVETAARSAGERMWKMPLPPDYRSMIDSEVADMKNTSGRYGGAIGAALLLSEFVGDTPWAHVDIAGPAWTTTAEHYIRKGGTGFGVRTLIELVTP